MRSSLVVPVLLLLIVPAADVQSADPEVLLVRLADARNGAYLTLDSSRTGANGGAFSLFVPNEGLYWSDERATLTDLPEGRLLVTYDGAAWLDPSAQLVPPMADYQLSGTQEATSISLGIALSADRERALGAFATAGELRTFVSRQPLAEADPSIDAALDELATEDWASLYDRYATVFRAHIDGESFSDAMDQGISAFGAVTSVQRLAPAVVTDAESGWWFAAAPFEVTLDSGGILSTHQSAIAMLYERGEWRIYTMDRIEP